MQIIKIKQSDDQAKKRRRKRIWLTVIIVLIIILGSSYFYLNSLLSETKSIFSNGQHFSLASISNAQTNQLAGESQGRTNILVYGLTADGHRTDTIILVSYFWKQNKVVTLNIPRDLWTNYNGYSGKIVSLYAVAQTAQPHNQSY